MSQIMSKDQALALRELILDGIESLHSGVEAAARQDAVRRVTGTQIQSIARGIEVFGKAVVIMNETRASTAVPPALPSHGSIKNGFGHQVKKIVETIARQASAFNESTFDVDFLLNDPVLASILNACDEFGRGGRYSHIEALLNGGTALPTYLAWNQVQWDMGLARKAVLPHIPFASGGQDYYTHMRSESVRTLQRLMRSFSRQLLAANQALGLRQPINREELAKLAGLDGDDLCEPVPISEDCRCQDAEERRRVWVYAPVNPGPTSSPAPTSHGDL
jgi:hypothetical protein